MREKQNYVEVLLNQRHMKERCLEATIKKLESKKKVREAELFLTQRKFFIDQVFDHHNELRFVKYKLQNEKHRQFAADEGESDAKTQNKIEGKKKSTAKQETDKKNLVLTEQLFMEKAPLKSSANLVRIQNAEKKLHHAVLKKQNSMSSITLKSLNSEKEMKPKTPRGQSSRVKDTCTPQFTVTNEKGEIKDISTSTPMPVNKSPVRPELRRFNRVATVPVIRVPGIGDKSNTGRRNTAPEVDIGSPRERFLNRMRKTASPGLTTTSPRNSRSSCYEYLKDMNESEGKKDVMSRHLASFPEGENSELYDGRLDFSNAGQYLLPNLSSKSVLSSTRGTPETGKMNIYEKDARRLSTTRSSCEGRLSACKSPSASEIIACQQSTQGYDEERKKYFGDTKSPLTNQHPNIWRRSTTIQQRKLSFQAISTVTAINQETDKNVEKTVVNETDDQKELDKRQEKLLKRLSASLPVHLLAKTQSQANGISEVLGFTRRNKMLMDNERKVGSALSSKDQRFEELIGSLCSLEVKKKSPFNFVF